MQYRCNQRRREAACEPVGSCCVLKHELIGVLCQLKHVTKCPTVVLKKDRPSLSIREPDVQIDENAIRRTPPLLIKNDGNRSEAQNLTGND